MKFIISNDKSKIVFSNRKIFYIDRYLICADSICEAVEIFQQKVTGRPQKIISLRSRDYCMFGNEKYGCKFLAQNLLSKGIFSENRLSDFVWLAAEEKHHIETKAKEMYGMPLAMGEYRVNQ